MAEKLLNIRIQTKRDKSTEWAKIESTFVPKAGEPIFYTDLNLLKIGDGTKTLAEIPFLDWLPLKDGGKIINTKLLAAPDAYTEVTGTGITLAEGNGNAIIAGAVGAPMISFTKTTGVSSSIIGVNNISGLNPPTNDDDAANKSYVDSKAASEAAAAVNALDVNSITVGASKTLSSISETNGKISATPVDIKIAESQVTSLVDDLAAKMPKSGGVFTGAVSGIAPTADAHLATKAYVDSQKHQTVKGNGTAFGDDVEVNIEGSGATTVSANTSTNTITISSTDTHNSHKINSGKKADGSTDILSAAASDTNITLGDSGVTAGEYGPTANQTPAYGATFNVPDIKVNAKGVVTSATNRTVKIPASDNTAHGHDEGIGLVCIGSGGVSGTVTYKAKLKDETKQSSQATASTSGTLRPVTVDSDGYLAVKEENTAHEHSAGVGLISSGGGISGTSTYKAKIRSETALSSDVNTASSTTADNLASVLIDKSGYLTAKIDAYTKSVTDEKISDAISGLGSIMTFKGTVATEAALKAITAAKKGDVYIVTADNSEWVCVKDITAADPTAWEKFGTTDVKNALYKDNNVFTNGSILVADGTAGKVKIPATDDEKATARTSLGLGAASLRNVDATISSTPSSTNLPTSAAVVSAITAHQGIDKLGTVTEVTATSGMGLKFTNTTSTPKLDWDTNVVLVLDGGTSTQTI